MQRLHYEFGPVKIAPGQNTIEFEGNELKPEVPGYIIALQARPHVPDGTIPRVDVIHLHHGVWISNFAPLFAAGRGEDDRQRAATATAGATSRRTTGS